MMSEQQAQHTRDEQSSPEVRFSVCAMTDLLGFSSHLEISGYDLRTAIGEQAIQRLEVLEEALSLIRLERERQPWAVPAGLAVQRINDAIICTMDLDDFLLPSIGQTTFRGWSGSRLVEFFDLDAFDEPDAFVPAYEARFRQAIEPIHHFLGIVARLHLSIAKAEGGGFFPGARTVVATGFRRPFGLPDESRDALSANFAFANVTEADRSLHGPHFFVDNNLIALGSRDRLGRNLMRFACFEWNEQTYDCLEGDPPQEGIHWTEASRISEPRVLALFRRQYVFRRLNPSPLSFLQHLALIRPHINEESGHHPHPYFAHILAAIDRGLSDGMIDGRRLPKSFLYGGANDLENSLEEFAEMLASGESPTRRRRHRRTYLEEHGRPELLHNEEYMAEMDALDAQEVTLDLTPVTAADIGDLVWTMSEEHLTGLLPIMGEDLSPLEFPTDEDGSTGVDRDDG